MKRREHLAIASLTAIAFTALASAAQARQSAEATLVEVRGTVPVVDLIGDYDVMPGNGESRRVAREAVARAFYAGTSGLPMPDDYDFLIAFTTFDYELDDDPDDEREVAAFYLPVRNDTLGIGTPLLDDGVRFGSASRLQGYVDAGPLDGWVLDPLDPDFGELLSTVAHELMHRWSARVRFRLPDGTLSDELLGHQQSHWSFLADTGGGSLMYGNEWVTLGGDGPGDGRFVSGLLRDAFNPFDLYLAGFLEAHEVPPMRLIRSDDAAADDVAGPGIEIEGEEVHVSIDDVIAAEGPRDPPASTAQRQFRAAFVLVTRPGDEVTHRQVAAIERTALELQSRWSILTGGRSVLQTAAPLTLTDLEPGGPDPVRGGTVRPDPAVIADALDWLRSRQAPEGYWEDLLATRMRDTGVVLDVLGRLDALFSGESDALAWLGDESPSSTDGLARNVLALRAGGAASPSTLRDALRALQNADGGWGLGAGYQSDPLDTALALVALGSVDPAFAAGRNYLLAAQGPDGSWGTVAGGAGRIPATALALRALALGGVAATPEASAAFAWLATKQNPDGGVGDSPSTAHDTAWALSTLQAHGALDVIDAGIAAAFLSTRQSVEGSWDGSVYTTALAADALQRLAFPNLAFAMPPTFEPDPALDGDGVRFLVPVLNDGGVVAPATVLEIWNGEPGGAGAPVAVCALPSIVPGATHGCEAVWDTTGQAGSHRVVLLLDAAGTLAELSETDNRFELDVEIGVSPLEADLEVRAAEVLVDPASPSTLPAPVSVTAIVRNNGRTDASDVAVTLVLRTGAGAAGEELVGLEVLPLLTARSSLPVSFAFELTAPGASELVLTADPEGLLDEGRIDNNTATVPIETTPSLDLAVNATDLEVIGVPLPGATVQLRVQAHNRGTLDANEVALLVALDTVPVAGAPERTVLLDEPVQIPAGGSVVRQVPWTVDREGELDLVAVLDLGNLAPEADETNNQASLRFLAGSLGLTNLRLLPGSLAVSPEPALEGAELAVSATLDNNGGALADEVVVALFEGHPEQGGVEMVRIQLAPLAPGEVQGFDLIVPELEGPQDRVLFLVVDPDGSLEEAVEDDNVLFRNLEVRGFADLAIGPAALGLDPAFPFPGQPASLEVEIANLGEQEAAATMLEVFAGDPLAGGVLLASAPTAALPAGALAATSVVFTPDPALEPGAVLELVVLVDRADVVRERSASNNRAVLEMLIGGGAANVSERWFSPNGDGVKDTTTFFFAAPQSGTFRVEVRDGEERPVVASTDLEAGSGTSSFRWDGRDGTGRLAADGDYSFRLVDGGGAELARTPVTLDTDRSPLLDAIGTAYEHVTDLTCQVPATGSDELAWSGDERWAFFVAGLGGARGVHRVRVDGSGLERIANLPDLDVSASDSGRYLAARGTSNRLFFADLQTGARSHVDLSTRIDRVLGFVPGEDRVVALARDAVHAVDVVSGSVTTLHEAAGARFRSVAESMNSSALPSESRRSFAPDGSSVLVARQLGPGARLLAIDLVSTAVHDLGPFRTSDPSSIRSATWLDGGPRIALGRLGSIEIFAGNGAPLASFTIPELPPPSTIVFPGEEPQPFPDDYIHTGSVGDLHGDGGGRRLLVEVPFIVSSPEACIDGARETFWVLDLGLGTWTRLDDDDDAPTPVFGCGSFHVETRDGGGFVERAVVHHGLRYRESTIDLSRHLPDAGGELRVRVRQAGGDNAHLDSLLLEIDGVILPPTSAVLVGVPGSGSTSITAELGALDHEVAAVGDATVEAVWTIDDSELAERLASDPPIHLRLIGREEYLEGREARPIELPAARPDGLEVVIGAAGALVVDGEQTVADALGAPLLRERARPDTGHPQGNVLGWVRSDGERLYAALDFTVDNTRDAEGDWGVLLVDGGSGWRELRVTETDSRWGRAGFGSSGAVAYPHRYYEFSIPLEELGLEVGDTARVRFAGYGTAALLDGAGAGFHTMKARGFLGDRSHVLFENRELGAASLGLRLERARDVEVPLFAEWNVARDFQPTASGRVLLFRATEPPEGDGVECVAGAGESVMALRSLANATAELDARLVGGGAVQLEGIASDRNFRRYLLEVAPAHDPQAWNLLGAPVQQQVLDGPLALWTPPAAGGYVVRLSVEDRAGNVARATRQVATAAPPDIADLTVAPRLVSPNGDGNADELVISYRVLRPILLRLEIHDADGRLVRAFDRSHPLAGEVVELRWDGRDGNGLPVPDGGYSVEVLGLELFFEVDRTPPEIEWGLSHGSDVPLTGSLSLSVRDEHLEPGPVGKVESGLGDSPQAWTPLTDLVSEQPERPGFVEEVDENLRLARASLLGRRFRIEATDAAGNRSVVVTHPPIAEEAFLVAAGPNRIDPETGSFDLDAVLSEGLHGPLVDALGNCVEPVAMPCFARLPADGAFRLRAQTTFAGAASQVVLQYRAHDPSLLGGGEEDLLWNERAMPAAFAPEGVVPAVGLPLDGFDLVWDLAGVDRSRSLVARLRVVDQDGEEHVTPAMRIIPVAPGPFFLGRLEDAWEAPFPSSFGLSERAELIRSARALAGTAGVDESRLLWGGEELSGELALAELFVQSADDGRYQEEARFEAVAIADGVFLFEVPTVECASYVVRLRAVDQNGDSYSSGGAITVPCMRLRVDLDPIPEPQCGATPGASSALGLDVTPESLDGATLSELRLELITSDSRELLDNLITPANGVARRFDLDLSSFPEGEYALLVSLINERDDVLSRRETVWVDRTPPTLEVTSPLEGQSSCGLVAIEGRAADGESPYALLLEPLPGSACSVSAVHQDSTTGTIVGLLGTLDGCQGEVGLRVLAVDQVGNTTCVDRQAVVDAVVLGGGIDAAGVALATSAGSVYQGLSPNGDGIGDGIADELEVELLAEEAVFADVAVHSRLAGLHCELGGTPVRTLVEGLPFSQRATVVWDGLDDGGQPVADGRYGVVAHIEDACGNDRTETFCSIALDASPPALEVTSPPAGAAVSGLVAVRGSVLEVRPPLPAGQLLTFDRFELDYQLDTAPGLWTPIHVSDVEVPDHDRHLATWRLQGAAGPVTLRLSASDLLGNRSEVTVPVQALDAPLLVSLLEPAPRLFSPNGDGRRDHVAIRLTLVEPVLVDLRILDGDGTLVRELVAGEALPAGAAVRIWDGLDDSGSIATDGTYEIEITARLASQPGISQTVRTQVVLDATPPAIQVLGPAGFADATATDVEIEVADANAGAWVVELAPEPGAGPPAWHQLAAGTGSIAAVVAQLAGLEEGSYRLRLEASDLAESTSSLESHFVVDGEPPVVHLLQPVEGGAFGGDLTVTASIDEEFLDRTRIELAPGADPNDEDFVLLVEAPAPSAGEFSSIVDVAGFADGGYVLRLVALDRSGNRGEARRRIRLDRSPPNADLSAPADGAWIREPVAIAGEASDANLASWTLTLAPAGGGGAPVELASGVTPVDAGDVLLTWAALPPDGEHLLRLTVTDHAGNQSIDSVTVAVDRAPPAPPTGFAGTVEGDDVQLSWQTSPEPDLAGYRLTRGGVVVAELGATETSAIDGGRFEGRYEYRLVAFDHAGNESSPAGPVSLVIDTTPPNASILRPRPGERVSGSVEIVGTAASAEDFLEYRLLIAVSPPPAEPILLRRSPAATTSGVLGLWDTSGAPEGEEVGLTLEAEDTSGNVARVSIVLTVDNEPPAVPEGLVASVAGDGAGDDVDLSWQANVESDLLGYVLLRDGVTIDALGRPTGGDLRDVALTGTSHRDADRPDGTFSYRVIAIDRAGNASAPSAPALATVETGAPVISIVEPTDGARVEGIVPVLVESPDLDVAEVRFEVRETGAPDWTLLGVDQEAPWGTEWDAAPLPFGLYELRATAVDGGGAEGPADLVTVELTELTPPPAPLALVLDVDGDEVSLSWPPVDTLDLAGYHVERSSDGGESWLRLDADPITATARADVGVADGTYRYRVVAADVNGNESDPSPEVGARVFGVLLEQPLTPTAELAVGPVAGRGPDAVAYTVDPELEGPDGTIVPLASFASEADGSFVIPVVTLVRGRNVVRVRLTDDEGHRSRIGTVPIVSIAPPEAPAGLAATVDGFDVSLEWDPNPEPDLAGYLLRRGGEPVEPARLAPLVAAVDSQRGAEVAPLAIDGSSSTSWIPITPSSGGALEPPVWIEVELDRARVLTGVELEWYDASAAPRRARVEAHSGEVWATVATVPAATAVAEIAFVRPYATSRVRLIIDEAPSAFRRLWLRELRVLELGSIEGTSYGHIAGDGLHRYELQAIGASGLLGPSASLDVPVGDVVSPEPVILAGQASGFEVELSWTASPAPDVAGYTVYRDGSLIVRQLDAGFLAHTDGPLPNGSYRYRVTASDAVGNESASSNEVAIELAAPVPQPPTLAVTGTEASSATLSWTPSVGLEGVAFALERATSGGGPYEEVVLTTALTFTDEELDPATTYWYVVRAIDAAGNRSLPSNEVAVIAIDVTPPPAPRLFHPARPAGAIETGELLVDVAAFAERGARVSLWQGGSFRREATATSEWSDEPSSPSAERVRFSADGSRALAIDFDGVLWWLAFPLPSASPVATRVASAAWLGSESILYATGDGELRRFEPATGIASSIAAADEIAEVAAAEDPSSGEQLVLVTAERLGQAGLWRLDLASGGWELLEPLDHAYALWDLAIAPRLAHVAFLSEVHGLALLELSSGEITPLGGDAGGPVAWSPDGGALLYVEESAPSQIWRFELDSEVASQVTDDPDGAYGPLWSPDGSRYAYVRDGWGLQVVEWGGEAEEVAPYLPEVAVWTAGGAIGSHLDGGAVRILPPGLARWNGIGLEPGVNLLSARARDEAGLESPFSEVITVILRADALPDLELRSGELAAIPPTVEPLSPVRISAVVRNRGAQAAAASELELELEDPAGQSIWTRRLPVRALEPGGFATVLHDVALEVPGLYRLRARADAGLVVPEGDEANNQATRELRVLEAGAPLLSVSSEQLRYEPGELVRGEVRVLAGGAFAGRLVVRFEDELGFPVATLIDDVVALAFGQERIEMLAHESAGLFAGAYRLRARLEDEAGVAVAEQVASFEIGETIRAAAALEVTPQVAVRPGAVTLAGVLRYLEGNALLEDVELALVLLDPSGVEAARWEQTAGGLLPGDQAPLGVVWSSGGAAPGRWTATLTASFGSQQLASAEAMLDLGLAPPRAVGELSTSSEVAAGSTVDVDFLVRNVGELDLTGAQVTVSLRRAPPAGVHASESVVVDLPNGGTATGAVSLDSSGLGLGSYLIVFEADLEAAGDPGGATAPLDTVLLDTATVMLVDAETPEVELRQPVDGGFLGLDSRAVVRALDRLSGVASVEVVLDAGPPRPAFRIEGDLYGALLEGVSPLEEGVHTVEARTRDRAGNQAATGVLTFTVDRTPPEITVLGVVDGQVGGAPVVPVIEIVEEHPGTLSLLLDGLPFTSGDLVEAPGIHRLDVVTADLAGNRAAITVRFEITIPTGSPVLGEIVGAPAQAALGAPLEVVLELVNESGAPLVALPVSLSLESAASGEQLVRVELTLDLPAGATSVPDLSIDTAELVPEPIELVLSADLAQLGGGIVELDRQAVLLVDATPPGLELLVPADGAIVPAEVVVQALATDAHSPIDLVEVAFDGGELVALPATGGDTYGATFDGLAEGGHALVARALDAAGNAAEVAIELTVDATPPVVEVSGVVDGQQSSDPLTPVVTVTDPHLEQVAILLDGEPFASGTAVSAPGPHLLEVEALDLAGNRAELAVAFEILQAAPVLTATFAADRVGAGGTVELVYEITNASSMEAASEIGFENVFVEELPTAAALPASGFCGPGSAATFRPRAANPARLAIAGAALGSGESCRFSVVLDVEVGAAGGAITNTAGPLTATAGGVAVVGEAAADAVELIGAPYLTAEITDDPVAPGGGATLELTLAHHASAPGDATGIAFGVDLAGALAGLHATGLDGMGLPAADVCGAGSLLLGGDRLRLEGGVLAPGESCVLAIDLGTPASAPAGGHEIVTSSVIATVEVVGEGVDVVGAAAGDDLIVAGLTLAKEFANDPVAPGGEVTLRFTLSNTSATSSATEILFTDDLVEVLDGLTATQLQLVGLCGVASTLDASEAGELLVFQGGSLGPGESCSFEVTLLVPAGAEDGDYLNVTRDLSAMYDGSAIFFESTNAADVLVVRSAPLVLSKEIPDDPVPPGGVARMRFTLRNLVSEAAFDIGFSDDLDAALPGLAAIDLPLSACGGAVVEAATSGGAIELTGAELSAGSACSFEVTLAVPLDGPLATTVVNTTSPMSAVLESGAAVEAAPASDELQIGTLVLEKAFDRPAAAGGTVALTFEIRNLSRSRPALDLAFTDDLDATLAGLVATGLPIGDLCGAGSSIDGWSILVLSEGSLLPGDSCTFPVVLQVPAVAVPGEHVNVTGPLSGGDGATLARPAVAVLRVSAPADNDGDGVPDGDDLCAGTEIPEAIPTSSLEPNHYALVDGDGVFDTVTPPGGGPGDVFTIDDTRGCSCEQIIDVVGLGNGHRKHGCSLGAMRDWVADVEP